MDRGGGGEGGGGGGRFNDSAANKKKQFDRQSVGAAVTTGNAKNACRKGQ